MARTILYITADCGPLQTNCRTIPRSLASCLGRRHPKREFRLQLFFLQWFDGQPRVPPQAPGIFRGLGVSQPPAPAQRHDVPAGGFLPPPPLIFHASGGNSAQTALFLYFRQLSNLLGWRKLHYHPGAGMTAPAAIQNAPRGFSGGPVLLAAKDLPCAITFFLSGLFLSACPCRPRMPVFRMSRGLTMSPRRAPSPCPE